MRAAKPPSASPRARRNDPWTCGATAYVVEPRERQLRQGALARASLGGTASDALRCCAITRSPRARTEGEGMSLYDYRASIEMLKVDPPFYALIMAAMLKADDQNVVRLRRAFPQTWIELQGRYNGPGGLLPGETTP